MFVVVSPLFGRLIDIASLSAAFIALADSFCGRLYRYWGDAAALAGGVGFIGFDESNPTIKKKILKQFNLTFIIEKIG